MPEIILGIDPGYGRMGFGVVQVEARVCCAKDYGVIKTPAGMDSCRRLVALAEDLQSILQEHKPTGLALEKIFFTKNQKTAIAVAEARGVVLLLAGQYHLPFVEFTPTQIKNALTGDGKATKVAVQKMTKQLLNLERIPQPDDAADALAIAITASTVRW